MVSDPIGDSLTRIKNALMRNREEMILRHTIVVENICRILKEQNRISDYKVEGDTAKERVIKVTVDADDTSIVPTTTFKRISKPGLRIYRGYRDLRPISEGYGFAILTTPKGIVTDTDAKKHKVGGEVICEIN